MGMFMKKLFVTILMFLLMLTSVSALYSDYYYGYDYYDYDYYDYDYYDNYNSRNYYYNDYSYNSRYYDNYRRRNYGDDRRYYYNNPSATLGYRTFTYGDPYKRGNFHYDNGDGYSRCGYYSCHMSYPRSYY